VLSLFEPKIKEKSKIKFIFSCRYYVRNLLSMPEQNVKQPPEL
jgi:hypothetical protein